MNHPRQTGLRAAARDFAQSVDIRDVFFFGGLLVAAVGGARLSWPWTLVIVGAVIALKGNGPLFPSRRGE